MKKYIPSTNVLRGLLSYDNKTKVLRWKVSPSKSERAGSIAKVINGYVLVRNTWYPENLLIHHLTQVIPAGMVDV